MIFQGFVGPSYKSSNLPISAQITRNWYPENIDNGDAVTTKALIPTPGYAQVVDLSTIPDLPTGSYVRQLYRTSKGLGLSPATNGDRVVVVGDAVAWIHPDNTIQVLGRISNTTSFVSICDDGFGMIIADGQTLWRLDMRTLAFYSVAPDLIGPTHVAVFNGYTIAIGTQSGVPVNSFFYSGGVLGEPYHNELWDALSYATCISNPSPIISITVNANYVWFGQRGSYELWAPTNNFNLPFKRAYTSGGTVGILAPNSMISVGNMVYMLGSMNQGSPQAFASSGTTMQPISDLALDQEWSTTDVSDCMTQTYTDQGHTFIIWHFDTLDKTYVYDATKNHGLWHERASRDPLTDTLHRWAPNFISQANGATWTGDRYSPRLFLMGSQYHLEDGNPIVRTRVSAFTRAMLKPFQVLSVTVDMTTGNGITSEDPVRYGKAPTAMMRYSWDSCRSFSSERRQTFGALGEYSTVLQYRNMGAGKTFGMSLTISDPVATSIQGAFIDIEVSQTYRT